MHRFKLKFKPSKINELASGFQYKGESEIINGIVPRSKKAGFINRKDFLELCEWKTPRSRPLCMKNSAELIEEITGISINTENEKLKIEILTLLEGVSWATASTILHFISDFNYPILDFRALWSLNCKVPAKYTFNFWNEYTIYCRRIAGKYNVSLRTLDQALWQYSSDNQD